MTDALLTEPREPGFGVPSELYEPSRKPGRASEDTRSVYPKSSMARVFFAKDRQRKAAEDLQGVILKGGLLSLLTLTIYRFWMKTDQRRLIWRETRLDGDGFEYTGTPLELLIGSMIAIVILAIWFGIVNLGLSYVQLAAWQNSSLTFLLAPLIAAPLVAFAMYRARRYRMLRTKWRGIRCGMDGSAVKYTGRWALWSIAQVLTLGFLTPHKRMALERKMTNHMLYGDARFQFEPPKGALRHLTAHWMLPWLTGMGLAALCILPFYLVDGFADGFFAGAEMAAEEAGEDPMAMKIQVGLVVAAIPLMLVYPFYLRYKSREIATILSSRRLLGARCESHLTWGATFKPVLAYLGYWLLLSIPIMIGLSLAMMLAFAIALILDGKDMSFFQNGFEPGLFSTLGSKIAAYGGLYLFYGGLILFSLWLGALIHFRRLHTYVCRGTVVHNIGSLDQVRQRVRDDQIESEGFADALDIGGI